MFQKLESQESPLSPLSLLSGQTPDLPSRPTLGINFWKSLGEMSALRRRSRVKIIGGGGPDSISPSPPLQHIFFFFGACQIIGGGLGPQGPLMLLCPWLFTTELSSQPQKKDHLLHIYRLSDHIPRHRDFGESVDQKRS